jgi:hypothetical protein
MARIECNSNAVMSRTTSGFVGENRSAMWVYLAHPSRDFGRRAERSANDARRSFFSFPAQSLVFQGVAIRDLGLSRRFTLPAQLRHIACRNK